MCAACPAPAVIRNSTWSRCASHYMPSVLVSQRQRVVILCAEAVWWRCHRRIISDYLLAAGQVVLHIMGNHSEEARLTPFAHLSSKGCLTYPATNSN